MKNNEQRFRDPETGAEIVAQNEIQASAFKDQGFKAVKGTKYDTEFASESLDPSAMANAQDSASANMSTAQANANMMNAASANAMKAEMAQDADMEQAMKEAQRQASTDATASASKTAKKNNK